jgi:hypothetical protein
MEVESLTDAQDAMNLVSLAAHDALGPAAVDDPDTGTRGRSDLVPVDEAAAEALKADDLGPGIGSAMFTVRDGDAEQS